ncbi:hypothetical protein [Paraburkholderia kururiensis]|uniref:hypothetical protein n=1 Tax=Paraburkholderia kururiensis TaxID=984307 RepID=UPI00034B7786|nr:hypothetical protein [Paraburkholderia kururiensis]
MTRPEGPCVVEATLDHVAYLAANLRDEDRAEVHALTGADPERVIAFCAHTSIFSWVWLVDGNPAAIFGLSADSLMSETGMPWLLTTPLVELQPITFLRHGRTWRDRMAAMFPHLENYVDARYARCIRWLEWLGFEIHPAAPYGVHGMPFHRFEMRGN